MIPIVVGTVMVMLGVTVLASVLVSIYITLNSLVLNVEENFQMQRR